MADPPPQLQLTNVTTPLIGIVKVLGEQRVTEE
jgi:hypothetical protein